MTRMRCPWYIDIAQRTGRPRRLGFSPLLLIGIVLGGLVSWARLTDPAVIRDLLLLREAPVFLLMGTAIAVAAVGCRHLPERSGAPGL